MNSEVFKKMLLGNMMESDHNTTVIINDIKPYVFKWFKSYCSGLNPNINKDNIIDILHFSNKYCMTKLYECCLNKFISNIMNLDNSNELLLFIKQLYILKLNNIINDILNSVKYQNINDIQLAKILTSSILYTLSPDLVSIIVFKSNLKLINIHYLWSVIKYYCKKYSICNNNSNNNNNSISTDKDNNDDQKQKTNENNNDDIENDEPPKKRRRQSHISSNMKDSNTNDNNNNDNNPDIDECWLLIMKQYFIDYFDFVKWEMNGVFFSENIYIYKHLLFNNFQSIKKAADIMSKLLSIEYQNCHQSLNDIPKLNNILCQLIDT